MIYRTLGRTGLKVSQLGLGAMRLPMTGAGDQAIVDRELAIPLLLRAFELGINYIDTAVGYCNQDSQRTVGEALKDRRALPLRSGQAPKGWRDVVVSTKNPYYGEDEKTWWTNLENSLQRLQVTCIDVYNHHGINWERYSQDVEPRVSQWMLKAKDQGLIQHICTSFHDDNAALVRLVDSGYVESITLQYNLLDRQLEEGIAYAHEQNVGVVVMGPVAGGRLAGNSKILSGLVPGIERVPELALRFVLSNPNVTLALSGMGTLQMVEENTVIASDTVSLSEEDKAAIETHVARLVEMEKLYCTGCKYCQPCPQEVNIPYIFEMYNLGKVYGLWDVAEANYASFPGNSWVGGKQADACIECGECEPKCPQKLQIPDLLKVAHEALTR